MSKNWMTDRLEVIRRMDELERKMLAKGDATPAYIEHWAAELAGIREALRVGSTEQEQENASSTE